MKKLTLGLLFTLSTVLLLFSSIPAEAQKAEEPVLLTSCGQSPGPVRLKIFMQKLNIQFDYNLLATVNDLKSKPYKTLIIVTGASLKGMGAAGISMDDELARTKTLIDYAKKEGITVIGSHIEGMARRSQGAAAGDNSDEQSIDAVCPNATMMLVKSEGNSDGRFTNISKGKNIPLVLFEMNTEMMDVLKKIFSK